MGMLGLQACEVASQVALRNDPRKWGKKSGYIEVCNEGGQAVWTSQITVNYGKLDTSRNFALF